jgi:hypothetical protein
MWQSFDGKTKARLAVHFKSLASPVTSPTLAESAH